MSFTQGLKKLAKALSIDYIATIIESAARLTHFRLKFGVRVVFWAGRERKSLLPIDIVIPVIDKDAETLPYVIDSARKHIRHPIKDIYLVCPGNSVLVKRIAVEKDCKVVDEGTLVPIAPGDIRYVWKGIDRGSWIYQQFLKWSGGKFCTQGHYLVMDSDTAFIRSQVFEIDDELIFDFCDEYNEAYFLAFERIVGIKPRSTVSFTSHHALIDIKSMDRLIRDIEALHDMPWYMAIISAIDEGELSCISDYDNYGQYFFETTPNKMRVRYWHNKSLSRTSLGDMERLVRKYGKRYSTLSFHSYNK